MSISSSAANEWPQVDEVELMASNGLIMEKPISSSAQEQQQQQQQALKCPRCDSSNTKFCYYNNYSLSQPRHFCKACKRYWTRGGTLRNVPVGGGCRKNKRVKRSVNASSSSSPDPSSSSSLPIINGSSNSLTNTPLTTTTSTTTSSMAINSIGNHHSSSTAPLFYGTSDVNHLTFPRFHNIKSTAAFDLQPQFSDLGLGFGSSSVPMTTQVEDLIASNSLLSGFNSSTALLGSSTPFIGSSLQNSIMGDLKDSRSANRFPALLPFRDLQMGAHHSDDQAILMKELKVEHGSKDELISGPCQNQVELFNSFDSSLYWNPTNNSTAFGANWPDLSNYGSSVTPLI
ncbi:hypothetical protein Scep_011368 [Stephania cephalantha]|uniref:Dof zinc finger protein n=1 Tax=Stephania cephalantha TaxID=152367 RepID=A0AAP0JE07_9MAGN